MLSRRRKEVLLIEKFTFSFHKHLADDVERWKCTTRGCKAYFKRNSKHEIFDKHLGHNHSHLDESVLRQKAISNTLKRKAQDRLHEHPAELTGGELEPADLNVLTIHDVNVIRKSMHYARSKCLQKLSASIQGVHQDSSNAASEETNEDDPLSENPHQSDGDLQPVCSDSVMQDCKHEIVFEERVTKIEPSVDSSDTTSGIDIVKFDPDFEFSPVLKKRDSEQNEVLEHVSTVKKERDNFDIFGELVAHKLRHLRTDYARTTVEHLISNILYEASMGKYDFPESNASSSASSQVTSSLISNL
ncbi:uncharacterized protein [Anabrus simplex]|uniref:uncharacterized protein isoform X3 n=1 Tax=Anabrus simplex TaxID=316456 RepID=UPI0034DD94B0